MKKSKRSTTRKKHTGIAIMKLPHIILAIVIICAAIVAAVLLVGPKMGLQTPPIEAKAMSYLQEHKFLKADESLTGYKALSYYNFANGAVITDQRVFVYKGDEVFSIPLDKISKVTIKNNQLGQQKVLISAQQNGMIDFDLSHKAVPALLLMLRVPSTSVVYIDEQSTKSSPSVKQEKM